MKGITDSNQLSNKSFKSWIDDGHIIESSWSNGKKLNSLSHIDKKVSQLKIFILCDEEPSYKYEFTSWVL